MITISYKCSYKPFTKNNFVYAQFPSTIQNLVSICLKFVVKCIQLFNLNILFSFENKQKF